MVKTPTFSHIVLMTRRFEEMKAWYCNVFSAHVVRGDAALAFLTYDDESHRFAVANLDLSKPDKPAASALGESCTSRCREGASEAELTALPAGKPSPVPAAHGLT